MNNKDFKHDLIKRAYALARKVLLFVDKFPSKRSAWIISDQLLRAATSIGANIIEAQAASSKKDFTNFLNHSLKSANETKFWIALSKDLNTDISIEANGLLTETKGLANILGASIVTLRKSKL